MFRWGIFMCLGGGWSCVVDGECSCVEKGIIILG